MCYNPFDDLRQCVSSGCSSIQSKQLAYILYDICRFCLEKMSLLTVGEGDLMVVHKPTW